MKKLISLISVPTRNISTSRLFDSPRVTKSPSQPFNALNFAALAQTD